MPLQIYSHMQYGCIIHGGAWDIPDETIADHLSGTRTACELAFSLLKKGVHAVDVVEQCVSLLEDDPTFDAGKGSFCNQAGQVEMDAIIATPPFKIGSVCALQNMKNPIQIARKVMDTTKHILLAGDGAKQFAVKQGFPEISPKQLLVGRELERYYKIHKMEHFEPKEAFGRIPKSNGMGTVGCVVRDQDGQFAIGVSTGGSPYKMAGRVGDTPLWGAGGYVTPFGGAATTGFGEDLIRMMTTFQACHYLEMGMSAQTAAQRVIHELELHVQGLGGVIILDRHTVGLAFNTPRMAYAFQTDTMIAAEVGIDPTDLIMMQQKFKLN